MGVSAGDTFVFDPTSCGTAHLWIVLFVYRPEMDTTEYALLVNITSCKGPHDDTACILTPSDGDPHPYVTDRSYAFYRMMLEVETSALSGARPHGVPVCRELLVRLITGALSSKHTARRLKRKLQGLLNAASGAA